MIYPFKYDLSTNFGFFRITISGSAAYFQYDIVNLNEPQIPCKKKSETCS